MRAILFTLGEIQKLKNREKSAIRRDFSILAKGGMLAKMKQRICSTSDTFLSLIQIDVHLPTIVDLHSILFVRAKQCSVYHIKLHHCMHRKESMAP